MSEQKKIIVVVSVDARDVLACPLCGERAVMRLTQDQLKAQPDDTTLVCHPALGGCNHGFAVDGYTVHIGAGWAGLSLREGRAK